jgi:D-Lysine 5,6-aminomutase TIM-barrel domain of alpha subunit
MTAVWRQLDGLISRAEALAGAWGSRARASTTRGQQRAILRLFGVDGVDVAGRPLGGAVVDRWLAGDPRGLANGIALPFAMALLEYDVEAQQLATDIAAGTVDLSLELDLLREPDRRAAAEDEARRLASTALARIDAERIVRRETLDLLGDATRPWLTTTLREPELDRALGEAVGLVQAGLDCVRVEVPIGRELADRLSDAGRQAREWRPGGTPGSRGGSPVPTGSQRALGMLRRAIDGAAAERRAYIRLATSVPALGAPEGAVVAAFERVDIIDSDAMAEIVADSVEPDRALADHAFAHRLARRAGTSILVGPGPLVVAPDLNRGVPSDAATRAGRALALQLLGVALARADGLARDQIIVGGLPRWLTEESNPGARAVAEISIRRMLFEGHPIAFVEPVVDANRSGSWPWIQAAAAVRAGDVAMIVRAVRARADDASTLTAARSAARVSSEVAASTESSELSGVALDHADRTVSAASATLDRLADEGWRSITGDPPGGGRGRGHSSEAVAERTDPFDPFGW